MAAPGPADRAADRFRTIRQSGGQALAEMARLVDILHTDVSEYGGTRLRMLLDRADAGGLRLRATPLPPYVRLPAEVEDVAYHVVQEGLTNAMKHAPGTEVQVRLTAAAGCLEVEVRNERASVASPLAGTGAGMGLAGMRERVESLAGELTAEPVNSGGFRVQARLPLAARELSPSR
jgi:signal transduction histidine kinase